MLTVIVLIDAVAVSLSATVLELVSGSSAGAAADRPTTEAVLHGASVPAFAGVLGLLLLRGRWGSGGAGGRGAAGGGTGGREPPP